MERRTFMKFTAAAGASLMLHPFESFAIPPGKKLRLALVGTGARGSSLWGREIIKNFGEITEFAGLCDINPGRLAHVKKLMKVDCPTFTDFEQMLRETKPDYVIVTTVDATHDEFIVKEKREESNCSFQLSAQRSCHAGKRVIESKQDRQSCFS